MSGQNTEIAELKAECAALRVMVAALSSGRYWLREESGRAYWQDAAMQDFIAQFAGPEKDNPHFVASMLLIRNIALASQEAALAGTASPKAA